jgi:hypothetical protein
MIYATTVSSLYVFAARTMLARKVLRGLAVADEP